MMTVLYLLEHGYHIKSVTLPNGHYICHLVFRHWERQERENDQTKSNSMKPYQY